MDISELQKKVIEFRDAREWEPYHNPKDLAISLSLEASELLEVLQWKDPQEVKAAKRRGINAEVVEWPGRGAWACNLQEGQMGPSSRVLS